MEVSFAWFDLCLDKGECAPCPESFILDAFASGGLPSQASENSLRSTQILFDRETRTAKEMKWGWGRWNSEINYSPLH